MGTPKHGPPQFLEELPGDALAKMLNQTAVGKGLNVSLGFHWLLLGLSGPLYLAITR